MLEKPFEPVPPKELSVYDEEHPLPADVADAAALRKWMTKSSEEQLAKMSDQDRGRVVRSALQAIVGPPLDRLPVTLMPEKFGGEVVVCVGAETKDPRTWLNEGKAVIAIRHRVWPPTATRPAYAGFTLGYNRSLVATQAADLLCGIEYARTIKGVRTVTLTGKGDYAVAALLAKAIAGDAVTSTNVELNGFDFDRIQDENDPRMIPGAVKYGAIAAFTRLCGAKTTIRK